MKKLIYLANMAIMVILVFASCKKDDPESLSGTTWISKSFYLSKVSGNKFNANNSDIVQIVKFSGASTGTMLRVNNSDHKILVASTSQITWSLSGNNLSISGPVNYNGVVNFTNSNINSVAKSDTTTAFISLTYSGPLASKVFQGTFTDSKNVKTNVAFVFESDNGLMIMYANNVRVYTPYIISENGDLVISYFGGTNPIIVKILTGHSGRYDRAGQTITYTNNVLTTTNTPAAIGTYSLTEFK